MAGLLDWLTDGIGSQMGSNPMVLDGMGSQTGPSAAPSDQATPPAPPTVAVPPTPPTDPSTTDGPGAVQGGGAPPVPMPQPRPAGAPVPPTMPPATPGASLNITPPAPNPDSSPAAPPVTPVTPAPSSYKLGDQTALGRSLGIDPQSNGFKSAMAGLGEGLTAAGNSKGKSAGAAFGAGAGGALTGGTKQDNTQYDQRIKALQLAVNAQAAGDKAAYNKNYAEYLKGKLANDEAAATPGGKKNSSWNKPDSQKFIDAQNAIAKDPDIRASAKALEQIGRDQGANSPAFAQAQAAHTALVQQKQGLYLTGVGLDPAKIQANVQNPPGTPQNPHVVNSKADFDTYVKPGQAYKNPSDGKIYIRKSDDQKDDDAADAAAPAASAPAAPAPPGPMPGTAATPASADDED